MKYKYVRDETPEFCHVPIDWTNPSHYPKIEDLTLDQWAWEFLRRNPEYLKDWEHFNNLPDYAEFEDGYTTNKIGKWKGLPMPDFPLNCFYTNPPALVGETPQEYECRMLEREGEKDSGAIIPYADYMYVNYKLINKIPNPYLHLGDYAVFSDEWGEDSVPPFFISGADNFSDIDDFNIHFQKNSEKAILPECFIFDALKPINKQLEIAKEALLSSREIYLNSCNEHSVLQDKRHKFNLFPRFIRILDAVEQIDADNLSTKFDIIAQEIAPYKDNSYPDYSARKSTKKNYETAIKYRDSNYWLIPKK